MEHLPPSGIEKLPHFQPEPSKPLPPSKQSDPSKRKLTKVVAGVTIAVLVAAGLGLLAVQSRADAEGNGSGDHILGVQDDSSQIKFNNDLNATVMDVSLNGSSVKWENPCGNKKYYLDPTRPYILCDKGFLFRINPDGTNTKLTLTITSLTHRDKDFNSTRIRYGIMISQAKPGYDGSFYNIENGNEILLAPGIYSRVYFLDYNFLLRVFRKDTKSPYKMVIMRRNGRVLFDWAAKNKFPLINFPRNEANYQGKGFFPYFPETGAFVYDGKLLVNADTGRYLDNLKIDDILTTKDGVAVFNTSKDGKRQVTTYDKSLVKGDTCEYATNKPPRVRPEQADISPGNLVTNQAVIDDCKFSQNLEKNPPTDNMYTTLVPNGQHQEWSIGNGGVPSYKGVNYPELTKEHIAGFFENGYEMVLDNGDVVIPGTPYVKFKLTHESKPVPYAYNKQFFIMGDRLWELEALGE